MADLVAIMILENGLVYFEFSPTAIAKYIILKAGAPQVVDHLILFYVGSTFCLKDMDNFLNRWVVHMREVGDPTSIVAENFVQI